MPGLCFEEFTNGQVFDHPWRRTVTEADNVMFCGMTMNPARLHLDAGYAAGTGFGRPLVNSLLTPGLMAGMSVNDATFGTTLANLGMTDVRFPKPVFHGDTLRITTSVLSLRPSASRPSRGIVEFEHTAHNRRNEVVGVRKRQARMARRPA